jgi:hypothetical protein
MSTWQARTITCTCGGTIHTRLADGLHITRMPAVRKQILEGSFHRVTCPKCGLISRIEKKLLYTDFASYHWIGVCPRAWTPRWSILEHSLQTEFERVICRAAPPAVQALGPRFKVRLVFGYDQLAEKLHIFDAGLDDRIVERVKRRVLTKHPEVLVAGVQMLLVPPTPGSARLEFEVLRDGEPGYSSIGCSRELYDEEQALPSTDDNAAFTSLDRVLFPPLADDGAAGQDWSEILGTPNSIPMAPSNP